MSAVVSTTLTILSVAVLELKNDMTSQKRGNYNGSVRDENELKSHYRHCCRSLTHRGNINISLSVS